MKAPETVVLSQSALESTMDAIEAHLRAKDPERFNALPWREQAEKDPEGFAEMSEIIRIAVSVTRPPPLQSGEIGELVERAISKAMGWQASEDGPDYTSTRAEVEALLSSALQAELASARKVVEPFAIEASGGPVAMTADLRAARSWWERARP